MYYSNVKGLGLILFGHNYPAQTSCWQGGLHLHICVCTTGRTLKLIRFTFFDLLQSAVSKIPASEVLIPLGDWNGLVGSEGCGFEEVHGGKGFGIRNAKVRDC